MGKHRNKKRLKLKKLKERLEYVRTLNYYHQIEDEKELIDKIKIVENSI